ncbi:sulfite exporter TauE/SafE family protein [Teredinibacter turnerae]|uniref:sulfite exporter TauE/SafE family protein n=1 Tax=Teredinibacter turnerae TaxID=2426 RepID=UPI0030CC574A
MSWEWLLSYALLGASVGYLAGLLGVAGGGLIVPVLSSLFNAQGIAPGAEVHLALATAFPCMLVTSAVSTFNHHRQGAVRWRVVKWLLIGLFPATYLVAHSVVNWNPVYISIFFALFMLLAALQTFVGWQPTSAQPEIGKKTLVVAGAAIGGVSAVAAVGGGFLAILFLTYRKIPLKMAIGSSAAMGLCIAISGTWGYATASEQRFTDVSGVLGYVYLPAFVMVSVFSILLTTVGVRHAHKLPNKILKKIFSVVCVCLSIKMLATALSGGV